MAELNLNSVLEETVERTNAQLALQGAATQGKLEAAGDAAQATKTSASPLFTEINKTLARENAAAKETINRKSALDLATLEQGRDISKKAEEELDSVDQGIELAKTTMSNQANSVLEYQNLAAGKNADGSEGGFFRKLGSFLLAPYYQSSAMQGSDNLAKAAQTIGILKSVKAQTLSNAAAEQALITESEYNRQVSLIEASTISEQIGVDKKLHANQLATLKDKYNWDTQSVANFKTVMEGNTALVQGNNTLIANLVNWTSVQNSGRAAKDQQKFVDHLDKALTRFNEIHDASLDTKVVANILSRPGGFEEFNAYIKDQELGNAVLSFVSTGVSSAIGNESTDWGTRTKQVNSTDYTPRDRLFNEQLAKASSSLGVSKSAIEANAVELAGGQEAWLTKTAAEREAYKKEATAAAFSAAQSQSNAKAGELVLKDKGIMLSELNLSEYFDEEMVKAISPLISARLADGEVTSPEDFGKDLGYSVNQLYKTLDKDKADSALSNLMLLVKDQVQSGLNRGYSELYPNGAPDAEFNVPLNSGFFGIESTYNLLDPIEAAEFQLKARATYLQRPGSSVFSNLLRN